MENENDFAARRLHEIRERIAAACARCQRETQSVTLVGASKTVSPARLRAFLQAGLADYGENYVQEGIAKMRALPDFTNVQWHLIGALQSNKAREAVQHFDLIHSVDRVSLAATLDKAARAVGTVQPVLLQVNIGVEASKVGCTLAELPALAEACVQFPGLNVCGLMCLPPHNPDGEATRPFFRRLREARDELVRNGLAKPGWQLSMGMSDDFEIAIEEGATLVRIGTALFGRRSNA